MYPRALAAIVATIVLAVAVSAPAPAPAAAPMTVELAQRELVRLAAPRYESMDGKVSRGVFVKQVITFPTACSIRMTRSAPAYRYAGQDFAAQTEVVERYVFEHKIEIKPEYPNFVVMVDNDRVKAGNRTVVTDSPANARRVKELAEWLGANCQSQGTRNDYRVIDGAMTCSLRAFPTLQIRDRNTLAFTFHIRPSTGPREGIMFVGFSTDTDPHQLNMGAYKAVPYFYIPKAAVPRGAARYLFYLDGRELLFPLKIVEKDAGVTVSANSFPAMFQLFRALAKGKKLNVRAYDNRPSMVGEWTYDLSSMRNLEATVKGTVRRC